MRTPTRFLAAWPALLLLIGGCERKGPLIEGGSAAGDAARADQLCIEPRFCLEMLPPREYEGVWVSAFEETSFMRGPAAVPSADDPRRYNVDIRLDEDRVLRRLGIDPVGSNGEAIYLRFAGRRTRDPTFVDCNGQVSLTYVVDRVIEARYLGPIVGQPRFVERGYRPPAPTVRVRHGGAWGEQERKAVARCNGREPGPLQD